MHEFTAKDVNKYYIDLDNGQDITVYDSSKSRVARLRLCM